MVESGSRHVLDGWVPHFRERYGRQVQLDLFTCYSGQPKDFPSECGRVYRSTDYVGGAARRRLARELAHGRYNVIAILCTGEPILAKWKWLLAARVPAKLLVINENGDYFWFDRTEWRNIRALISARLGLTGSNIVSTLFRLLALPFGVLYLLAFAGRAHLRRYLHLHRGARA